MLVSLRQIAGLHNRETFTCQDLIKQIQACLLVVHNQHPQPGPDILGHAKLPFIGKRYSQWQKNTTKGRIITTRSRYRCA